MADFRKRTFGIFSEVGIFHFWNSTFNYRFLTTPLTMRKLAHEFVIGAMTASAIVSEVTVAINRLFSDYLPRPNASTWAQNEKGFRQLGFPNIIGAIDGKHFWCKVNFLMKCLIFLNWYAFGKI